MKVPDPRRRCKCRDGDGRELGQSCPKLRRRDGTWNPAHGTVGGRLELPPGPDGSRTRLPVWGFRTETEMAEWFGEAIRLLSIPEAGPDGHEERTEILALIKESRRKKAALPDHEDLRRRHRHGAPFSAGTTGEYLLGWLASREQDLTSRTLASYESHVRRIFLPAFGDVPLGRLRQSHIVQAFAGIDARNAEIVAARASSDPAVRASVAGVRVTGPATKQRIRATLRSALSDAAAGEHPLTEGNPARYVRLAPGKRPKARVWTAARVQDWQAGYEKRLLELGPSVSRKQRFAAWHSLAARPSTVMVWTPGHLGTFLDYIAEDRLYALYHLIAFRGLRRGEACGLRWPDTDLDRAVITILTQLVQSGWDVQEDDTKTEASDSALAINKETVAALRSWRAAQAAERLLWGEAWASTGRVFTKEDGTDLHPANVTTAFEWLAYEAGLPPIRLHDLRHGAATLARAAGADMKEIQLLMRHSSSAITIDTYTSVFEEVDAELAEKMALLVPRRAAVGDQPGTHGLPTGSQARKGTRGFMRVTRNPQVGAGGAPGGRTLNQQIKSRREPVPDGDE